MKNKLILYNHFHNGDIFYSRIIINPLKEYFDIIYYHNLKSPLFEDMPEIEEIVGVPKDYDVHGTNFEKNIVNTWIGQKNMHYVSHQPVPGCSFNNHLKLALEVFNFYKINLNEKKEYLPVVFYDKLKNYNKIKEKLQNFRERYKLIILVCDGDVNSGQSHNFNFVPIIESLAQNQNCLFLSTNKIYENKTNILNTYPTITETLPDLLSMGLISRYCDIIIGRASGPVCYTHTKDNFDDTNKTFISFSHNESEGVFYSEGVNKNIWSNNFDFNNVKSIIQKEIDLKLN